MILASSHPEFPLPPRSIPFQSLRLQGSSFSHVIYPYPEPVFRPVLSVFAWKLSMLFPCPPVFPTRAALWEGSAATSFLGPPAPIPCEVGKM